MHIPMTTHNLSPAEYTAALNALNLTPEQAAIWLGIGRSTAYRYLKTGCEGPVVVAIRMAVAVVALKRWDACDYNATFGKYVRHSDLTAALSLPNTKDGE